MLKNVVRLGAAAGCAYAAYLFGWVGANGYPQYLVPAAACGAGAALLGHDGVQGFLTSAESTETM